MPPPQSRSESPRERAERHAAAAAAAEAHAATEAERAQIKEATKHMRRQKTTPRSPKEERRAAAAAAAAALGEVEEQRKCLAELRKQHAQQQQPRVDRELEALWRQALAHKLTHNAGVKNMRAAVQSGRFSCEHYIAIWRGRLESLEREPEPEPEPELDPQPEPEPEPELQVTGPSGAREGTSVAAAVDFQAVQRQLQTLTAVVGSIAGAVESLEAERNHALTWSLCGPLVAAALLGGAVGAAITGVRLLPPPVGVG
jgi:hypothetical protein